MKAVDALTAKAAREEKDRDKERAKKDPTDRERRPRRDYLLDHRHLMRAPSESQNLKWSDQQEKTEVGSHSEVCNETPAKAEQECAKPAAPVEPASKPQQELPHIHKCDPPQTETQTVQEFQQKAKTFCEKDNEQKSNPKIPLSFVKAAETLHTVGADELRTDALADITSPEPEEMSPTPIVSSQVGVDPNKSAAAALKARLLGKATSGSSESKRTTEVVKIQTLGYSHFPP